MHADSQYSDELTFLSTSASGEYVVSVESASRDQPYNIKVARVAADTLEEIALDGPTGIAFPKDLLYVGSNTDLPVIVWTNQLHNLLYINIVGTSSIATFDVEKSSEIDTIKIHAPTHSTRSAHFLIQYQSDTSDWAEVFHVDSESSIVQKVFAVPAVAGRAAFSISTTESGIYFTRFTGNQISIFSSSSSKSIGDWSFPKVNNADEREEYFPVHAQSEVLVRNGGAPVIRSVVLLSNGDWTLIKNGEASWYRPESLAGIVAAEFVDLEEAQPLIHELEIEEQTNFISSFVHRLVRHVHTLSRLAVKLGGFKGMTMAEILAFGIGRKSDAETNRVFGFGKTVVVATENGRLIGLDTGNHGVPVFNIKAANLGADERWTAQAVGSISARLAEMSAIVVKDGIIGTTDPTISSNFTLSASLKSTSNGQTELTTYGIENEVLQGRRDGQLTWQFVPQPSQRIHSVTASVKDEPVASIGKVLGDRRVLYKYQNPNAILVITTNGNAGTIAVHLLDATSGVVLYASQHGGVETSRPIAAVISENWFAYSFTTDSIDEAVSKGYQLVVSELYESELPNDRGPLGANASFSSLRPTVDATQPSKPHVIRQIFHLPEEIGTMAVTQTSQGITSRDLLVGLPGTSAIVAIPRLAVDPRRLVGKDPTPGQMEEGLTRYSPMIDFDPKWHLTHRLEVMGVRKIIAAPATLESTSLVFAYGVDVFGTRVAPSFAFDVLGGSFNKLQLVLTVVALTLGAFVVAPLVQRKQTNALWQSL